MKLIIIAIMLTSLSSAAGIFSKTPGKEFLSRKIGIWVPSLAEPEARNFTLLEFADGAFRNVTSKDWEETDDSWILVIKIKDPMTKKKSIAKMQFLKSDKVAGPRRITMDGEDLPMQQASSVMHPLLSNVSEKFGSREIKKNESAAGKGLEKPIAKAAVEPYVGKYQGKVEIHISKLTDSEITFSANNTTSCLFKEKAFKKIPGQDNNNFIIDVNSHCKISVKRIELDPSKRASLEINSQCKEFREPDLNNCLVGVFQGEFVPVDY